jgi:hypothetical protein
LTVVGGRTTSSAILGKISKTPNAALPGKEGELNKLLKAEKTRKRYEQEGDKNKKYFLGHRVA